MAKEKIYRLIEDRTWNNEGIIEKMIGTENEVFEWILKNTSFSFQEATKNQGYKLIPLQLRWEKVYVGPFSKKEAEGLAKGLQEVANPIKNSIFDAKIKQRSTGHDDWDVYIKSIKE